MTNKWNYIFFLFFSFRRQKSCLPWVASLPIFILGDNHRQLRISRYQKEYFEWSLPLSQWRAPTVLEPLHALPELWGGNEKMCTGSPETTLLRRNHMPPHFHFVLWWLEHSYEFRSFQMRSDGRNKQLCHTTKKLPWAEKEPTMGWAVISHPRN